MNDNIQRTLNLLMKLGRGMLYEHSPDNLLIFISDLARDLVDAERCSVFLYNEEDNTLYTRFAHGVDKITLPADKGIVGYTIKSGDIQIVLDAYSDSRFYSKIDDEIGFKTKNLLTVPLFNREEKIIGVLEVINKKVGFFTNFDAELLLLSANYISFILENMILSSKIRENNLKLIYKLTAAAEFKDQETSLHTKRVALYSEVIARKLNVDDVFIERVVIGAPMHDIGKIGIPDAILNKPSKLTDEEFKIITTHSSIGYRILYDKENPFLKFVANIAKDHHERWDGLGYPNSLKCEDISLQGRIVAIADVFDALTSKRPYKDAWSFDKSFGQIMIDKGTHFDPHLVEIFNSSMDNVLNIYNNFREVS